MFLSNNEMVDVNQTLAVPDEDKGITTELLKSVFATRWMVTGEEGDRKSTRLNYSHRNTSRMPSSA